MGISLVPSSAAGLQQAGVVYRPLSIPQASLTKLVVWRKGPCPIHLNGFLGAVRQAAALLRTSAAVRRACRPAPEDRFAIANNAKESENLTPRRKGAKIMDGEEKTERMALVPISSGQLGRTSPDFRWRRLSREAPRIIET